MKKRWIITTLIALCLLRIIIHVSLYVTGFRMLMADDAARVINAALWVKGIQSIWYGAWLPFQSIIIGIFIKLYWNLLFVPWVLSIVLGLLSVISFYFLSMEILNNKIYANISTFLLATNHVHIWLSSVPLSEIYIDLFIFIALAATFRWIKDRNLIYVLISSIAMFIANGIRYESWIISIILCIYQQYIILKSIRYHVKSVIYSTINLFPLVIIIIWLLLNKFYVGDYYYFSHLTDYIVHIRYNFYDMNYSYQGLMGYSKYLLLSDPIVVCIFPILFIKTIKYLTQVQKLYFFILLFYVLSVFVGRNKIEGTEANFVRYSSLLIFLVYPLFIQSLRLSFKNLNLAYKYKLLLIIIFIYQLIFVFKFQNDMSSVGIKVGNEILNGKKYLTGKYLVELKYWDFLALHVGYNGFENIYYDKSHNWFGKYTNSIFETADLKQCFEDNSISLLVVNSDFAKNKIKQEIGIKPYKNIASYSFYRLPPHSNNINKVNITSCRLVSSLEVLKYPLVTF